MKAAVLTAWALNFPVTRATLGGALYRHHVRHGTVMLMHLAASLWGNEISQFQNAQFEDEEELKQVVTELVEPFLQTSPAKIDDVLGSNSEIAWWAAATQLKNEALYVDWTGQEWVSPGVWSDTRYADVSGRADSLFGTVAPVLGEFVALPDEGVAHLRRLAKLILREIDEFGSGVTNG